MLVSICIAAYNAEKYISKAIDSASKQTYKNIEIIVCDDASTDATNSIVDSLADSRIRLIRNDVNLGYLKTFNRLLSEAKGEFISFLDADDWIEEEKLEKQLERFSLEPDLGLVGTGCKRVNENGEVFDVEIYPERHSQIEGLIHKENKVDFCGSSVMIRRCVYESIGGYKEFYEGMPSEDYDWICRIMENFKVANIDGALYNYRFSNGSLTRKVHYDVVARHSKELVLFLRKQRSSNAEGLDALTGFGEDDFKSYIESLTKSHIDNPSSLYFSTSVENAINGDAKKSLKDFYKVFRMSKVPFKRKLKLLSMVLLILIVPNTTLLKVKAILGWKNVSKSC